MPPRKRAHDDGEAGDDGASHATQGKSAPPPAISPDELDRLVDSACRYALLCEHSRKPLAKDQLKEAVLGKDRPDRGGKIMKLVIATASQRLLELAGLELLPANSAADAEDAGPSQAGPSQADDTQEPTQTQTVRASGATGKLIMVNKLPKALVPAVQKETAAYHGLVEVILTLIMDNGGRITETDLHEAWLPKLGLKDKETIPGCGNTKVRPPRSCRVGGRGGGREKACYPTAVPVVRERSVRCPCCRKTSVWEQSIKQQIDMVACVSTCLVANDICNAAASLVETDGPSWFASSAEPTP
jgi:hypothetical protein